MLTSLGRTRSATRPAGLAFAVWAAFASPASALESTPATSRQTVATLVTDTDQVLPGQAFNAALRLRLAPGWHTYWQNPGAVGIAPELAFTLPPGSAAGPVRWPAPARVAEGDLVAYAYHGDVLLPVAIQPSAAPLSLHVHASWLACRDLCVPEDADFTLELPAGQPSPSAQAPLFAAAAASSPVAAPFQAAIDQAGTLSLSGSGLPADVREATFFPSEDGRVETSGPQQPLARAGVLRLRLSLGGQANPGADLPGVVALQDTAGSLHVYAITARWQAGAGPGQPAAALLLLALAGGLLLNLMPCVFPILAMKAMALARMSGGNRRAIRAQAASYTLGVVAAFTMLGAAFVALRQTGQAVGWGFQFQSPVFVTAVAWLLFATGLNMSGVFSVGQPAAGAGQSLAGRQGHLGSFFTGLLAVVVATPCTASFMGAAIAGALTASTPLALLVFATMGIGLAAPYAAIAAVPDAASLLPRPGRWMATLQQLLAFPMYAAAVWLLWVVSQQSGPGGVLVTGAGLLGTGFAAWLLRTAQAASGRGRRWGHGLAIAAAFGTAALLFIGAGPSEPSEPFTAARLAELRSEGRPVFVNMTAAWCLSCLVNEQVALAPHAVQRAFAQAHVAYLKGDWTRKDAAISDFLRQNGRDGVPLYLFYAPGQPAAVLPQLLSERTMLEQVSKAGS